MQLSELSHLLNIGDREDIERCDAMHKSIEMVGTLCLVKEIPNRGDLETECLSSRSAFVYLAAIAMRQGTSLKRC